MHETFADLLRDPAHWEFELLVGFVEMIVFDVLIFGVLWKHIKHHLARDKRESDQNIGGRVPIHYEFKKYGGSLHENLIQMADRNFDDTSCFFCHGVMMDQGGVQRCDSCGAVNIHDEWQSPDVPTATKDQKELEAI